MIRSVVVCGAGTMGTGIAQTTASYGYPTVIYDINDEVLKKSSSAILQQLENMVAKNKISGAKKNETIGHLRFTDDISNCKGDLIIEAVAEIPEVKTGLFKKIFAVHPDGVIYATNTSSLSVTALAKTTERPQKFCGLHFFNPAPLMKLVEIVQTEFTDPEVIKDVIQFTKSIQKEPVLCADSPGFIVNRVARHFYLESLKLVESSSCTIEDLDLLLESAGFKMGPFKLMDLIGNDVNLAVTQSLYEAFDKAGRFTPSPIQELKVKNGELGRKSGKGYYNY